VAALAHLLPIEPVRVVGRPDVRTVVWPLVPALAALAVPIGGVSRFASWTWVGARPAWHVRTRFVATVAAAALASVVLAPVDRVIVLRNLVLFDGLALGALAILGRPPWSLLIGLPVVVWFTGVEPPDVVRWWAVPLLPADHLVAALVSAGTGIVGAAAYVAVPARWAPGHRS
jgi:hypothetical protein